MAVDIKLELDNDLVFALMNKYLAETIDENSYSLFIDSVYGVGLEEAVGKAVINDAVTWAIAEGMGLVAEQEIGEPCAGPIPPPDIFEEGTALEIMDAYDKACEAGYEGDFNTWLTENNIMHAYDTVDNVTEVKVFINGVEWSINITERDAISHEELAQIYQTMYCRFCDSPLTILYSNQGIVGNIKEYMLAEGQSLFVQPYMEFIIYDDEKIAEDARNTTEAFNDYCEQVRTRRTTQSYDKWLTSGIVVGSEGSGEVYAEEFQDVKPNEQE